VSGARTTVFAGRYRVVRRLGAGGTAAVFLARDERLDRDVAVKRLHGAEVTAETAQRLQNEARIMASLHHPNLVTVYDMLTDEDDLLLAMEYVHGETLDDVLADGPLQPERLLELLEPVAEALDHVHDCGVVHRDLKPSNILVGADGAIKVADLGLATAAEITKITPPGAIVGTPAYMAPEQATSAPCTAAVDVYALASIAYRALSGTLPRPGGTVLAVLHQATREPPPDLRDMRPGTPAAAAEALMRGMSAAPEERQPSASRLVGDLAGAFRHAPAPRPPAAVLERSTLRDAGPAPAPRRSPDRRARLLAGLALAAAAAAVVVLVAALSGDPPAGTAPPAASSEPEATPTSEPAAASTPAAARELTATATVRAFYRRAAAGDHRGAWALAGPGMRQAFGGSFERFRGELSSLRHIEFERVEVTQRDEASATVENSTVATHEDRVDRCSGALRTVRDDGGRWVVEPAGLQCTSG